MSTDPGNVGAYPLDPQTWNMYSYVRNNPLALVDPTGTQEGDCDSSYGCTGIGIVLWFGGAGCGGGYSCDRQPPIHISPAETTDPNPPAGDPNASDPWSGPIWQEGGPQITPTGNLAALFGLQMPSPFIINNFTIDQNGNVLGSYNGEMLCTMVSASGPFNPRKDETGKCKPCPPDTAPWEAQGNAHGSTRRLTLRTYVTREVGQRSKKP